MDIALAAGARHVCEPALGRGQGKLAALHSTDELVAFLGRSPAWRPVSLALPAVRATDRQFSGAQPLPL